jgi:GGDEF domain-containing protein
MKSKLTGFYCFFVVLMFLVSIFTFGFSIFSEYTQGENRCDSRFEQLSLSIKQLTNRNAFFTKQFDDRLSEIVLPLEDFAVLHIKYNSEDYLTFCATENEYDALNSKYIYNKAFSFSTNDGTVSIIAAMYLIRPSEIARFAKISFLMILITTIITIILIIILNHNSRKYEAAYSTEEVDNQKDSGKTADEIIADMNYSKPVLDTTNITASKQFEETPVEVKPVEPVETLTAPVQEEIPEVRTEPKIEPKPEPEKPAEPAKPVKPVAYPVEEVKPMVIKENENKTPEGLFSSETGLGWEQYLKPRLENELNRAISSEVDLALFLIKIPCIEKSSAVFKEICEYLTIQFQFKDLLFEYKEDSIAAIKINTDVDEALTFSEKLQADINEMLKDYPSKCYIGISTRTVRMMSAERLLKETDEALIHAQEDDDCQIIAFRADAIKYRQFMENN